LPTGAQLQRSALRAPDVGGGRPLGGNRCQAWIIAETAASRWPRSAPSRHDSWMRVAVTSLSILGAALSFIAAFWLLVGFNPESPRYRAIRGGGYTQSDPVGLRQLLVDQGKVAAVATVGAGLQLLAVVLALTFP